MPPLVFRRCRPVLRFRRPADKAGGYLQDQATKTNRRRSGLANCTAAVFKSGSRRGSGRNHRRARVATARIGPKFPGKLPNPGVKKDLSVTTITHHRLGWVGTGRMGFQLVERLLGAGCDVSVYNRTRAKAEPLAASGAVIVESPADLADCDIVFTMVAASADFIEVVTGPDGILSNPGTAPGVIVDSSTVSTAAGEHVREAAAAAGSQVVAAPVSGNPSVVRSGRLTSVASGPRDAFDLVEPYLNLYGAGVTYVGEGEVARLVKICHNLMLGIVTQALAEITVLAEKAGVSRADFMAFINQSVMGSTFSQYKTPAIVNLDWTPTFTGHLLRKDFELGLEAGRQWDVSLPTTALVHQIVVQLIGSGLGEGDFMRMLELQADGAGLTLRSEEREVSDGLDTS